MRNQSCIKINIIFVCFNPKDFFLEKNFNSNMTQNLRFCNVLFCNVQQLFSFRRVII